MCVAFFSGVTLDTLRHNIGIYLRHTTELHTGYPLTFILILQLATELLFDTSANTRSSDSTEHVLVKEYGAMVKNDDYMMAMLHVFQGAVYYVWGQHDKGLALTLKTGILMDKLLSHSANMPGLYHQSVSLYASAQKSSKTLERRRWKRLALKRHKILRGWAKDGCCNVLHYVAALDAELAMLNGAKKDQVEKLYQKAIVVAARGGWVQDAAVANERLARYFQDHGETVEAGRRFEQAIEYYNDWGFTAKADCLRQESEEAISIWSISRRVSSDYK